MKKSPSGGRRAIRLCVYLVGLALPAGLFGQVLRAEYDFLLDLGLLQQYRSELFITPDAALFYWGRAQVLEPESRVNESGEHEFNVRIGEGDSLGVFNYTDRASGLLYSKVTDLSATWLLREPAFSIKWDISSETRTIGPYKCRRADAIFRGRSYRAWFTMDIPTPYGPWKLHGLPGLVVELREAENRAVFRLARLEQVVELPEADTEGMEVIDLGQYAELLQNRGRELMRRIQTKLPRGAQVQISGQQSLERFNR